MEKLIDCIELSGGGIYCCQVGDTLDGLAEKYSTTKAIIIRDNNLDGEIYPGDCLYIKSYKNVYVVTVSDTAETVAAKLKTTVEKLYELNGIDYVYPYLRVIYEDT